MTTTHALDFYAWTQAQASFLQLGHLDSLDLQNLAEEIEDMGRSEKRSLESRMEVLIMHLLKWDFQPDLRSRSWELTIKEQRLRLQALLDDSPSLKPLLITALDRIYKLAVIAAERETGLNVFPDICPYAIAQIMVDRDFEKT
jgi:hypothetical protein